MKKIAAVMLILLMVCMPALALKGEGYPVYDGGELKEGALGAQIGEERLLLAFDPGSDYSYLRDGYVQACFFAFDAAEEYYLELYLLLPEEMRAGDVLTPESCYAAKADSCSVALFEVDEENREDAWFAGQMLGAAYPTNSSFSIRIDEVKRESGALAVRGRIEAGLCLLENGEPGAQTLALEAEFSLNLPLEGRSGSLPKETPVPEKKTAPAFTLPPDYIVL